MSEDVNFGKAHIIGADGQLVFGLLIKEGVDTHATSYLASMG